MEVERRMRNRGKFVIALVLGCALPSFGQRGREPVEYVSPNIGTIGQLLSATVPYVQRPHGMARVAPVTTPGIADRYLANKIYGLPAGPALLMASVGETGAERSDYATRRHRWAGPQIRTFRGSRLNPGILHLVIAGARE